jgi:uncharacterized membrane protein|tara:strand:- start:514 stop:1167 length:654 start_codon:yes stop_codon:yes gene_type:complete
MSKNYFSKKEALTFGYNSFKKNYKLLILVVVFLLIIANVPEVGMGMFDGKELPFIMTISLFIIGLVFWALEVILSMGLIRISLKLLHEKKAVFVDLFHDINHFLDYIVASILYILATAAGLILLIVPGIIFMVRFQYFGFFIIEKKFGPVESLKASWHVTDGVVINILLFNILLILINVLGAIVFVVGLLVSIPVSMMANVHVYNKLQTRLKSADTK